MEKVPVRSYDLEFTEQGGYIGQGADGIVYQCTNKFDMGEYAVKKIPFNETTEARVRREVRALAALQHPNIIQYFQSWEKDGIHAHLEITDDENPPTKTCFVIMELCPSTLGKEMSKLVEHKDILKRTEIVYSFFHQILGAVEHLHNCGWIHRDLSSDNIFIDRFGKIKIGDFSLAVETPKGADEEQKYLGKLFYRAPENGSVQVTSAADVYSLGVLLFEMIYPMEEEYAYSMEEESVAKSEILDTLIKKKEFPTNWHEYADENIEHIIKNMLKKDPKKRPSLSFIRKKFPWSVGKGTICI